MLDRAAERGLFMVLDVHHEDELARDPTAHGDRFLDLWSQLARHFGPRPVDQLVFELLNEPRWELTA